LTASISSTRPERGDGGVRAMASKIAGVKTKVPQPSRSFSIRDGFSTSCAMRPFSSRTP
jgi:hypothetical protein